MPRGLGVHNDRLQWVRRGEPSRRTGTLGRTTRRAWGIGGLRLVAPGERRPAAPGGTPPNPYGKTRGAPCWLGLAARDLSAAKQFYGRVLGWCHVPLVGQPGRARSVALKDGLPVGTITETDSEFGAHAGWMPYFYVDTVDAAAARFRERGATVALGPPVTVADRVAVVSGPDGAVFGLREQTPDDRWTVGDGPIAHLELHTRDVFAAALFYGGPLGWSAGSDDAAAGSEKGSGSGNRSGAGGGGVLGGVLRHGGACDVAYDDGRILLRDGTLPVATLREATAPGSTECHRWHACFRVPDVDAAVAAAVEWGGRLISRPPGFRSRREAVVSDPDGVAFTVVAP
ncbi:VOC family protein [Streptomyces sp. NPDC002564]|uniref:VOC family protein n=1 Tax=Streptomyces sp. NPDC002564 TaxID=3364649 RepID=UPI0036B1FB24